MAGLEIVTFGCRLNALESEIMRGAAGEAGLGEAVIVNTCAVTAEAERQARQAIRRARREHPNARIIVTGCAATLAPERYTALAEVDLVLDNAAKLRPESYAAADPNPPTADAAGPPSPTMRERDNRRDTLSSLSRVAGESLPRTRSGAARGQRPRAGEGRRARAYLQVQQGCDHRCTSCIIPYARGPNRSVPLAAIVDNARDLVASGANEIVLTGVDLTAYGADLPDRPTLGKTVRDLLAAVPELRRLRLSSLDPGEIDEDLWRLIATESRLMPHLHLSLQAGDDLILKRMKRRHTRAQAIATARRAGALRPDIMLGADLIAGFPTETDSMFRNTLDLIGDAGLGFVHVFPYSPRPGTPAARMPQLAPALVRERAARLRETGAAALAAELTRRVGRVEEVLIEAPGRGRAACYAPVRFAADARGAAVGAVRHMRFVAADASQLIGAPV
ncbi:MAG: tRNA (N(6)-L-threonylcarbamoyladenosine(37)-C(2))-methylthiotransferase MtaB [Alphaproteobacteria bacterium]